MSQRDKDLPDIDEYLLPVVESARDQFGDDVFDDEEAKKRIIVLELPALSLKYLFQSSGMALGRMTMIAGQEGACKSAFLYEIFRWHRKYGNGKCYLFENESKDSPSLRLGILEYDEKACVVKTCRSLEDWQEGLTRYIDYIQSIMDGKGKTSIGRSAAICFGIDSLTGTASRDSQDSIRKHGFATREHPVEALLISKYMRTIPQKIASWPMSICGTNHLKPSVDMMGRPIDNIVGGMSLKFQETYGIKMQRVADIDKVSEGGVTVNITMIKNSLGQSRKKITADLKWYWEEDEETGESKQIIYWDWYGASIAKLLEYPQRGEIGSKIMQVVDLNPVQSRGKYVWSNALGISKNSPATYEEAGKELEKLISSKDETKKILYPALGISEYKVFKPGTDIRDQMGGRNA